MLSSDFFLLPYVTRLLHSLKRYLIIAEIIIGELRMNEIGKKDKRLKLYVDKNEETITLESFQYR